MTTIKYKTNISKRGFATILVRNANITLLPRTLIIKINTTTVSIAFSAVPMHFYNTGNEGDIKNKIL